MGTHRLSWTLTRGPIPDGLWILHQCDVKLCVNPAHLRPGTPSDNTGDTVSRARAPWAELTRRKTHRRGSQMPAAKLTDDKVREIRRRRLAGEGLRPLAAEFGISESGVSRIALRRSWTHVE